MKKKKNIIWILVVLIIIIGIVFFIFQNQETKLTTEEKKWISDNTNKIQNVHILNNTNIFGKLGKGLYYSFINNLNETYNLKVNFITMENSNEEEALTLTVGNNLPNNAMSFYEDHYVLVSKTREIIHSFDQITLKKIGIIKQEESYIEKYINGLNNTYIYYNSEEELLNALDAGEINAIIVPKIEYIDKILKKNYWITFHFSDIKRYYYLMDKTNSVFYQIIKKYYLKWQKEEMVELLAEEERNLFKENLGISEASLAELQKKTIIYGYRSHAPYEVYGDSTFGGILYKYLDSFKTFAKLDIEFKKYNSEKKLIRDINNNQLSLYFNYKTISNNGNSIETNIPLSFDIFVHESNDLTINSLNSLIDKTIYVEKDSYLQQYLKTIDDLKLETYESDKINEITKKKDAIIAIDHETGYYLRKSILKRHIVRYHQKTGNNYIIKSLENETLNSLLARYINYKDNFTLINKGIYQALITEAKGSFINSLAKYALYSVVLIIIILLLIYRSSKRVRMQKKIKKEDRLKYIDQLTSLKNRNYLNENLANWNKNTIYPQSVIMIDLDRVQEINDTLGYEEGDRQIKAAANSLIKTQLDNTDIIRTNGNEFMIYLVGYNQKQITSYIHKLTKEFKNLPFDYGICITYSMIVNDLKLIEDAINECVEDIKKQKKNKKEASK